MGGDKAWQEGTGLPGSKKQHGPRAAGVGTNNFPSIARQGVYQCLYVDLGVHVHLYSYTVSYIVVIHLSMTIYTQQNSS